MKEMYEQYLMEVDNFKKLFIKNITDGDSIMNMSLDELALMQSFMKIIDLANKCVSEQITQYAEMNNKLDVILRKLES